MRKYIRVLALLVSSGVLLLSGVANAKVLGLNLKDDAKVIALYQAKDLRLHFDTEGEYTFTMATDKEFNDVLMVQTGLKLPVALINDTDNINHIGKVFTRFDFVSTAIRKQTPENTLKQTSDLSKATPSIIKGQTRSDVFSYYNPPITTMYGLVRSDYNQILLSGANVLAKLGSTVDAIATTEFNGYYFIFTYSGGYFNLTASKVGYNQQTKYKNIPVGNSADIGFAL